MLCSLNSAVPQYLDGSCFRIVLGNKQNCGLFNFFSKDKKETLDKGLEKTKQSFFNKLARTVVGKSKVDDDVLDNLEEVLITSDVGVETTLKIINKIEQRVSRDKVLGVGELNSILKEEITTLLQENNAKTPPDVSEVRLNLGGRCRTRK